MEYKIVKNDSNIFDQNIKNINNREIVNDEQIPSVKHTSMIPFCFIDKCFALGFASIVLAVVLMFFSAASETIYQEDGKNIPYVFGQTKVLDKKDSDSQNKQTGKTQHNYYLTLGIEKNHHSVLVDQDLFNSTQVGSSVNAQIGMDKNNKLHFKDVGVNNFTN